MLLLERPHGMDSHGLADALLAEILTHTYVVEAAPPAVMAAQNCAYNLPPGFCHNAGRRVPADKTLHAFLGIIHTADAKSFDGLP